MENHEVTGAHQPLHFLGMLRENAFIYSALFITEISAVAFRSVQMVVNSLRNPEEIWIPRDDDPPRVGTTSSGVRN